MPDPQTPDDEPKQPPPPLNKGGKPKKRALGRGLDALIPGMDGGDDDRLDNHDVAREYFSCDIDAIRPNPYQPRTRFSEDALNELADSIREQGVLQPLLVRKAETGYELIAGERRYRAAKRAGLWEVPVVVKDISDDRLLELSLIENIQRQDLNPLEEADAYYLLTTRFDLTQDEVARRVGRNRATVTNFLRLRGLPDQIKETILDDTITMGHARALLSADTPAQQNAAWREVVTKGLSVRETEQLIRKLKAKKNAPEKPKPDEINRYLNSVAEDLSRHFGTKVEIHRRGKKGKVEIEFYSDDDLDRLLKLLNQEESVL